MVRWCWAASTSVGARRAACPPASTAASIARSATTVFPEPTSPWRRRCIGTSRAISSAIVVPISRWPAVSSNGSRSSKASRMPPARTGRGVVTWPDAVRRRCANVTWRTNASSYLSRRRASSTSSQLSGVWMPRSAAIRESSRRRSRTSAGSGSGTSSRTSRTRRTLSVTVHVCREPDGPVDRDERLAVPGVEVVEHRVPGVRELEPAVVGADGSREDAAGTGDEDPLVPPGLEEGDVDVVPAVGDDDVEHRPLAPAHRVASRRTSPRRRRRGTRRESRTRGRSPGCGSGGARTPAGHRRCGCRARRRTSSPRWR